MKQLSELGISPAPWKVVDSYQSPIDGERISVIESANGKTVSVPEYNNGSLIAAAPKMYEALRVMTEHFELNITEWNQALHDALIDAKTALAEASGESEVKK